MEIQRTEEQIHARRVAYGEVEPRVVGTGDSLQVYLVGLQLDAVFRGCGNDVAAYLIVRLGRIEPDIYTILRRDTPEIVVKFDAVEFSGRDLPTKSYGKHENQQSESEYPLTH